MNDTRGRQAGRGAPPAYRRHREYWGDRLQFPRMSVANRAKQFAPFAAVSGVDVALARKERRLIPHPELSEDALAALDQTMARLAPGSHVAVEYYRPSPPTGSARCSTASPRRRSARPWASASV